MYCTHCTRCLQYMQVPRRPTPGNLPGGLSPQDRIDDDGDPLNPPGQAPQFGSNWPRSDDMNPYEIVDGKPPVGADQAVVDKGSADKGDLAVSRQNLRADCVVSADKALFDEIASGETNVMAALLRGALRVEGDIQLLALFQRLFPGPSRSRKRRPTAASARTKR